MKEFIARNLCWLALRLGARKRSACRNEGAICATDFDVATKRFNDAIGKIYRLE